MQKKLSKELGIRHYDLDELQWDNESDSYGVKRDPVERDKLLCEVLKNNSRIIEGVYYTWCQQCFADADKIYVLNVPRYKYRYRIIRRFVRRKLGFEQGKKETLKSFDFKAYIGIIDNKNQATIYFYLIDTKKNCIGENIRLLMSISPWKVLGQLNQKVRLLIKLRFDGFL